jgi:hypothetical protein
MAYEADENLDVVPATCQHNQQAHQPRSADCTQGNRERSEEVESLSTASNESVSQTAHVKFGGMRDSRLSTLSRYASTARRLSSSVYLLRTDRQTDRQSKEDELVRNWSGRNDEKIEARHCGARS